MPPEQAGLLSAVLVAGRATIATKLLPKTMVYGSRGKKKGVPGEENTVYGKRRTKRRKK